MKVSKMAAIVIFLFLAMLLAVVITQTIYLSKAQKQIAYITDNTYLVVDGEIDECTDTGLIFCKVNGKQVVVRIFLDHATLFKNIGYPAKGTKVKLLKNGENYFLLLVYSVEEDNNE